ncbi:MAG: 50S ribosomal protein L4 [Candidatus Kerfeldbacteria bacterium]
MTTPEVTLYNTEGKEIGTRTLPDRIFGVAADPSFVERAVVAQRANSRVAIAHTKTRSEVRGGGKKPWKQKGTGRARHGSIRSPIWRGGGVTFGPRKDRNFSLKINRKERQKALFMALSDKILEKRLILVDALNFPDIKTKKFVTTLKKLPIENTVLVVLPEKDVALEKSARNVAGVTVIQGNSLNVIDVLNHRCIVMPEKAIGVIEKTYTTGSKKEKG